MTVPESIDGYQIQRVLGAGAMGTVLLARHPRLGIPVAIKVLHERDPGALARFRHEAEVMARITNPNVVEVLGAGLSPQGPYLVQHYCEGEDLAAALKRRGALPPWEAAELVAQIASGVEAAHRAGVVHRDLKPANVLLVEGRPMVTDFGIARGPRGIAAESMTQSGALLGTPGYMAPEQMSDARTVDARSDVYALGVILYECLAGEQPFVGSSALAVMNQALEGSAKPLPAEIPADLVEVVATAMALEPADRFSTAADLAESLRERRGPAATAQPKGGRAGALGSMLGAVLLLGSLLGSLLGYALVRQEEPASAQIPPPSSTSAQSPSPTSAPSATPQVALRNVPGTPEFFREQVRYWNADLATLRGPAAAGELAAMTRLGLRLALAGDDEARVWLERAAEQGDGEAMFQLAYRRTFGGRAHPDASIWLERCRLAEDPQFLLASAVRASSASQRAESLASVVAQLTPRAQKNEPRAVAALLRNSFQVGDLEGFRRWSERGIELELREAYALSAWVGIQQRTLSPAQAAARLRRAVEFGSYFAMCAYSRALFFGRGVPVNRVAAKELLAQAEAAEPFSHGVAFERARTLWAEGKRQAWQTHVDVLLNQAPVWGKPRHWADLALLLTDIGNEHLELRAGLTNATAVCLSRSLPMSSFSSRVCYLAAKAIHVGTVPLSEEDRAPAFQELLERSASFGFVPAIVDLGAFLLTSTSPKSHARGIRLLEQGAALGDPHAYELMGRLYLVGFGESFPKDWRKGIRYLEQAAKLGNTRALYRLAGAYQETGDLDLALSAARRGADLDDPNCKVDYGFLLVTHPKSTAEEVKAGVALLESLSPTTSRANEALSSLYQQGQGVPQSDERAQYYANQAVLVR